MAGVYSDGATGLAGVYTIGHGKHWHGRGMRWLGQGWGVHHWPCRARPPARQAARSPLGGSRFLHTFWTQAGNYHHDQTLITTTRITTKTTTTHVATIQCDAVEGPAWHQHLGSVSE